MNLKYELTSIKRFYQISVIRMVGVLRAIIIFSLAERSVRTENILRLRKGYWFRGTWWAAGRSTNFEKLLDDINCIMTILYYVTSDTYYQSISES